MTFAVPISICNIQRRNFSLYLSSTNSVYHNVSYGVCRLQLTSICLMIIVDDAACTFLGLQHAICCWMARRAWLQSCGFVCQWFNGDLGFCMSIKYRLNNIRIWTVVECNGAIYCTVVTSYCPKPKLLKPSFPRAFRPEGNMRIEGVIFGRGNYSWRTSWVLNGLSHRSQWPYAYESHRNHCTLRK